jgi:hypothetical protein
VSDRLRRGWHSTRATSLDLLCPHCHFFLLLPWLLVQQG